MLMYTSSSPVLVAGLTGVAVEAVNLANTHSADFPPQYDLISTQAVSRSEPTQ